MGRKSTYTKENDNQAGILTRLGAIDDDLAEFFNVSKMTINSWKKKHPSFMDALKSGKASADDQVEKALFSRALGYSHEEEKIFCHEGVIVRAETTKHYPPSEVACIFWLKNRRPDKWRQNPMGDGDNDNDLAQAFMKLAKVLPD